MFRIFPGEKNLKTPLFDFVDQLSLVCRVNHQYVWLLRLWCTMPAKRRNLIKIRNLSLDMIWLNISVAIKLYVDQYIANSCAYGFICVTVWAIVVL